MSELNFVKKHENNKEEQQVLLTLLRAYAVASKKKLNLPSVTFLDEISGQLGISRSKARDLGEEFIKNHFKISNFNFKATESLYLGMYNASSDTGSVADLNAVKNNVIEKGFIEDTIRGFKVKPVKFNMLYGKFKKSFEFTQEYGPQNFNSSKRNNTNVQFILKLTKGNETKGASFNIYESGRVRFSGGYLEGSLTEPRILLDYISKNYFKMPDRLPVSINNTTAEIKINSKIRIIELYTVFNSGNGIASFKGYNISATFEPERDKFITKQKKNSPFLYVSFKKDNEKFTLVISPKGGIIIEGAANIQRVVGITNDFLLALKESGLIIKSQRNRNTRISPKKTKLVRRLNMKPAPDITRRGTSCPMSRRPNPYGFQGGCPKAKHYVRPNPQGQPCCYKIPKSTAYIQNKIENRYNKANVKVPTNVRKTFGFGQNTNTKQENVGRNNVNYEIYFNKSKGRNGINPVGLKIGSRQCSRFSKVALVDIARRKGLQLPKKLTKPILCDLLSKVAVNINASDPMPRIKNGKVVIGKKVCSTYKKSTLVKLARTMGISVNKTMSKEDICQKMKPKRKSPSPIPRRSLPVNLLANIKKGKSSLKPLKQKSPSPKPLKQKSPSPKPMKQKSPSPKPLKKKSPSPNSNDENFSNLINFAKKLRAM